MFDLLKEVNFELYCTISSECKDILSRIEENKDFEEPLELLKSNNQVYSHSITVSYLSMMLATYLKVESPVIREVMFTTALFHDVGKTKINQDILTKDRLDMTYEEKKEYEKHSDIGAELLASLKRINPEIPLVIGQHHEYANGMGYPKGIHNANIHPHARHLILCNEYVQILERAHNDHKRAYHVVTNSKSELFDTSTLDAFKVMFKLQVD